MTLAVKVALNPNTTNQPKITCSMCTSKRMIPRGSHSTQLQSFIIVSTKTGKNILKSMSNVIPRRPGKTFEQRKRAIGMLTAGMSARDVARHFQRHESTISRLLNRFQQTGTDLDQADRIKPRHGKTVFSRLHLDAIDFFVVER